MHFIVWIDSLKSKNTRIQANKVTSFETSSYMFGLYSARLLSSTFGQVVVYIVIECGYCPISLFRADINLRPDSSDHNWTV